MGATDARACEKVGAARLAAGAHPPMLSTLASAHPAAPAILPSRCLRRGVLRQLGGVHALPSGHIPQCHHQHEQPPPAQLRFVPHRCAAPPRARRHACAPASAGREGRSKLLSQGGWRSAVFLHSTHTGRGGACWPADAAPPSFLTAVVRDTHSRMQGRGCALARQCACEGLTAGFLCHSVVASFAPAGFTTSGNGSTTADACNVTAAGGSGAAWEARAHACRPRLQATPALQLHSI